MAVRIIVGVDTWVTDEGDPPDVEWGNRESTDGAVTEVEAWLVSDEAKASWYGDPILDVDAGVGDTVYAVVVDYSTGDTFGRDGGYYQVLDAFTDPTDAYKLRDLAKEYEAGGQRFARDLTYKDKSYYASWIGYFEYTNDIKVWECEVTEPWTSR